MAKKEPEQKYYRLRMQALKWWLFALDENLNYLDDKNIGPFKHIDEANAEAMKLRHEGILDLDRQDNVPRGSQLK